MLIYFSKMKGSITYHYAHSFVHCTIFFLYVLRGLLWMQRFSCPYDALPSGPWFLDPTLPCSAMLRASRLIVPTLNDPQLLSLEPLLLSAVNDLLLPPHSH